MFHWTDGWFFERATCGDVHIVKRMESKDDSPIVAEAHIPESEWASIVTSVSKDGETWDRWMQARRFHGADFVAEKEGT